MRTRWRTTLMLAVVTLALLPGCSRTGGIPRSDRVEVPRQGEDAAEEPWAQDWRTAPNPAGNEKLPREAEKRLDENGFVVLGSVPVFNVTQFHFDHYPHLITSDVVLYVFGTLFRGGIAQHERRTLAPMLGTLVSAGVDAAQADLERYRGTALESAARANLLLFGVAAELLGKNAPRAVAAEAAQIVAKIKAAEETGFYPDEDWTIYAAHGHYAENRDLVGYFRATKWLSRYIMPLQRGAEAADESDLRLRQAVLLGQMIRDDQALGDAWRVYTQELDFLIGPPDSIDPVTVAEAADRFIWVASGTHPLAMPSALSALRAEFASSAYPESAIMPVPQGSPGDLPTKYCQLIGERYVVDSEIMQRTCFPWVNGRVLPGGLDVAATVLGSERARTHLEPEFAAHPDLRAQVDVLSREFGGFSTEADSENAPIYDQWLGTLAELAADAPAGAPEFTGRDAWRDKQLNTALASWAMLRHDYVLYGKQPEAPGCVCAAMVEPVPEVYRRIGQMASALDGRGFPGMAGVAELCRNLREVCAVELGQRTVDELRLDEGYGIYLAHFGHWLLDHFTPHIGAHDPTTVVDVSSTKQGDHAGVLEVGTGPLYPIYAKGTGWDGSPIHDRFVGVAMSYHEWEVWSDGDAVRMTDEQWRDAVRSGDHHDRRPQWTESFMVR
jgi:hypothetical protein